MRCAHRESRQNSDMLKDKTMVTAFYQPALAPAWPTRPRCTAGWSCYWLSDAKMTRAGDWYQESIKDTVKMLEFYGDVIVMRHFQQGAPQEAAKWASVPIINGGTAGASTRPRS